MGSPRKLAAAAIAGLGLLPALALADVDRGDTAWMLTATALVLFMTVPGLSIFYGGLVRAKNVLSVLMQCLAITALVTVLWVAYGYSLVFDQLGMQVDANAPATFIGGISKLFLRGV
jgi:Amt family ammonium transporter